jgi:hypothetical protein
MYNDNYRRLYINTATVVTQYDEKLYTNPNLFNAVQTKDGRWVTSINALHEFSDIFNGIEVTVVQLAVTDFPTVTIN